MPRPDIEALGRRALADPGDVTDPEAADGVVKAVIDAFGKVDILVNNAGITRDDLIMRMAVDACREVLETNLFGAFYTTKAVMRPMLKARGGRIVNITSVSGQAGQTGQANYSSAKAGLDRPDQGDRARARVRGITCNAVAPGFVLTELTQDLSEAIQAEITTRTPLGRFGTADGDRERRRVPRQRRGRVHHRPGPRRRRRPGDDVGTAWSITHVGEAQASRRGLGSRRARRMRAVEEGHPWGSTSLLRAHDERCWPQVWAESARSRSARWATPTGSPPPTGIPCCRASRTSRPRPRRSTPRSATASPRRPRRRVASASRR